MHSMCALQLFKTNCDTLWILTPFCQNLLLLSGQIGPPGRAFSLLTYNCELWPPKTLLLVHPCSFLEKHLIELDLNDWEQPTKAVILEIVLT